MGGERVRIFEDRVRIFVGSLCDYRVSSLVKTKSLTIWVKKTYFCHIFHFGVGGRLSKYLVKLGLNNNIINKELINFAKIAIIHKQITFKVKDGIE